MIQPLPVAAIQEVRSSLYAPKKEDKFSFGLWTAGNTGHDAFGAPARRSPELDYTLEKLAALGAWGVNFQDDDLVAYDASYIERSRAASRFKQRLTEVGLTAPMATTSLFVHPAFKEGAFTAVDPGVRAFALQKTMRALDVAAEVGAPLFNLWGAREGVDAEASKDPAEALKRLREALNFLCQYSIDQGYELLVVLEAKPNEPRSDNYLPTVGHMLAFISTLAHPALVGVNAEVAHEIIANLNFYHEVAQVLEAGKLWHIDLNDQRSLRFDENLRFGSENLKTAFFTVKLLEESGYDGPRHFDVHPYRTEDEAGVWDSLLGCMHTYNMLKEKAQRFAFDQEIQALLAEINGGDQTFDGLLDGYSRANASRLKTYPFDPDKLARRGYGYERLDQLTVEIILGVR